MSVDRDIIEAIGGNCMKYGAPAKLAYEIAADVASALDYDIEYIEELAQRAEERSIIVHSNKPKA